VSEGKGLQVYSNYYSLEFASPDFRLMKDLSVITHTDANKKVQECRHLLDVFTENPKCKEKAALW